MNPPPLRLLHSSALYLAQQVLAAREAEDAAFRTLSLSTDRDDSPPDRAALATLVRGKS
jgi:hypothetical protein